MKQKVGGGWVRVGGGDGMEFQDVSRLNKRLMKKSIVKI